VERKNVMPIRLDKLEDLVLERGPLHLALGVFDGVHIGHQAVIDQTVQSARASGGMSFVVTFSPHPIRVISASKAPNSLLATLDDKASVMKSHGVDGLLVIHFDHQFAAMPAENFVRKLCAADVASISVGEDWRFGNKRLGDVNLLKSMADELGFELFAVPPVIWDGERISSTRIRQAIRDGNFHEVEAMLGRHYELSGRVIEGQKLGRTLGFPTANLHFADMQLPKDGVWLVEVNSQLRGVANLGVRPTVDGRKRSLEVHLLNFSGDLYGQILRIRFIQFIREERKFSSIEGLREQIATDVLEAQKITFD
jgi:riboflavin kinase/FMN adenylyltransferase